MKTSISVDLPKFSSTEELFFKELGLSDHEIQVYQVLAAKKTRGHTAQNVASVLTVYPNAVYRIFRRLESFGLARLAQRRPLAYQVTDKVQSYVAAATQKKSSLDVLLGQVAPHGDAKNGVRIIVGRQALYNRYVELAQRAKTEICVFAIGIAYSEELRAVQKNAIKQGVRIRHIVQKLQPSNYSIIHKWQGLGVGVRYFEQKHGYHLTIIDQNIALVTFSSPEDTEDRLSIEVSHSSAVQLFQSQFEILWVSSKDIKEYGENKNVMV